MRTGNLYILLAFLCNLYLYGQSINTMLITGNSHNQHMDSTLCITFEDTADAPLMKIITYSGGTDSIKLDTIKYIFFDPEGDVPVQFSSLNAFYHDKTVIVRWTTESEQNNLGWNVFRSDNYEGPFEKLNSQMIAGYGTVVTPHSYSYEDHLISGPDYYYKLEQIDIDGTRTFSWAVMVSTTMTNENPILGIPGNAVIARITPNPVINDTKIAISLDQASRLTISVTRVYDSKPEAVLHSGFLSSGTHQFLWNGCDQYGQKVPEGTYCIVLKGPGKPVILNKITIK